MKYFLLAWVLFPLAGFAQSYDGTGDRMVEQDREIKMQSDMDYQNQQMYQQQQEMEQMQRQQQEQQYQYNSESPAERTYDNSNFMGGAAPR